MTRLCVPIPVRSIEQARRDALLAAESGADLVELRIDLLDDVLIDEPSTNIAEELATLIGELPLPAIVTRRAGYEGGQCTDDDETRLSVYDELADASPGYFDVEWRAFRQADVLPPVLQRPRGQRPGVIVSAHDFDGRPSNLLTLFADMTDSEAEVVKLAWRARSIRDNIEAFELLREHRKPTIALCMGEAGLISRVLAKKFGGFLTFASLRDNDATADGQVTIRRMKSLYRWDAIGPDTQVFGVVAHPVAHSLSPHVHNAAFTASGYDGVYLPMLVQPGYESFKAAMETFLDFAPLDVRGLSVTLPHKEHALRWLRERTGAVSELAHRVGAVNTLTFDAGDGLREIRGTNTDYDAILDTITQTLSCERSDLKGAQVAVLGAGGTGRTAVAALSAYGAEVSVFNRTRDRAQALAAEFDGSPGSVVALPMNVLGRGGFKIYINTTSVGLAPKVSESVFDPTPPPMNGDTLVFDTIYTPAETKLLAQAREAGAKTVNGEPMFLNQAAAQFREWTGLDAPLAPMRDAFLAELDRRVGD